MKQKLFLLIRGATALCVCTAMCQLRAQTPDDKPTAVMTFANNSSLSMRCKNGQFPLVAASAGQTVNIQLCFPLTAALTNVIVEPLDGGTLPSGQSEMSIATDGTASIQFQPGNGPGLYRVLLNQVGSISTLRFWVADPQQPNSGPPALQPE